MTLSPSINHEAKTFKPFGVNKELKIRPVSVTNRTRNRSTNRSKSPVSQTGKNALLAKIKEGVRARFNNHLKQSGGVLAS